LVVEIIDIHGSPNIGVYTLTTNKFTIIPLRLSSYKSRKVKECLNVEMVATTLGGTMLAGVLAAVNSNGMVMPHYVTDEELEPLRKFDMNVERINSKKNAFGNLILVNDKGAIVDEDLMKDSETMKCVKDTLDIETTSGTIAGLNYVGSLAVATNKGVIAHPMIKDDERKLLREVLKVPVNEGTVNLGVPFVASGLMANDHGALAGNVTTGPEIFIIGNALDVV